VVNDARVPRLIPSKQFEAFRRLYARFLLEPFPATGSNAAVLPYITPITDADELLKVPTSLQAAGDLTGTVGTYVAIHTVPNGQRWILRNVHRAGSTGSSAIWLQNRGVTGFITINATGELAVSGLSLRLDEADTIGMRATGNGADTAILLNIIYDQEAAF